MQPMRSLVMWERITQESGSESIDIIYWVTMQSGCLVSVRSGTCLEDEEM